MEINLIHWAIPAFVLLLLLEIVINSIDHKDLYDTKDTFSSLAMGIGNVIIGIWGKALVFGTYYLIYQFRLFTLGWEWYIWILAFFADDISYYWFHRKSHEIRFFWASHVVHHSSRKYNLSTALRQTWTGNLTGAFLFWIWMPFLGFHPIMVMTMQAISLIYQFWIHTETIDKLPRPIEFLFNTPSHHRVHHGSNPEYIDKNHAGVLIIWDRIFGTFQPELYRPTYGLTRNINTYNPFRIAFHEWHDIWKDVRTAQSLKEGFLYAFGRPGWRPVAHRNDLSHQSDHRKKGSVRLDAQLATKNKTYPE
ncbi:sterol desaturase family protein [Membranicola marinus]|uniref:Sterol desaturase family protein n=1 Tax=Membranihabitans marinus TaxID=1227546 RepID=A0A953HVE9_9BACT|nr:sterol desaturase family protein [Membranihabitans marinus]MBY5957256.1 sterol desaturase family protein [Membranihabitans marinus]